MSCVHCDKLRAENRDLRRELRTEIEVGRVAMTAARLRIQPAAAWIVLAMYDADSIVTTKRMMASIPRVWREEEAGDDTVKVHISRIRKAIGRECVETFYKFGYALTPKGREKVSEIVG